MLASVRAPQTMSTPPQHFDLYAIRMSDSKEWMKMLLVLAHAKNLRDADVARLIGVTRSTFCSWKTGAWYSTVTRRQVMKCLQEGELIEDPRINNYGDIECSMALFCAGIDVTIDVVVKEMAAWTAIIIRVGNKK